MRATAALLLFALATATALPARDQRQFGFFAPAWGLGAADYSGETAAGDDSAGASDYSDYSYPALDSMLKGMQTMMTRMRQQLTDAMSRFPSVPATPDFRFPAMPHPVAPFKPSDAGFDESKPTNSSSVTHYTNGHKVTVNETTYESQDGGISSVFRIKIVDVKPHKGEGGGHVESASGEASVEPEDSSEQVKHEQTTAESLEVAGQPAAADNEIPQRRGGRMLAEASNVLHQQRPLPSLFLEPPSAFADAPSWGNGAWPVVPMQASAKWQHKGLKSHFPRLFKPALDSEVLPGPITPIDLSGDLKVNQLLSEKVDAGGLVMPDPDSEFVELVDGKLVPNIQST